MIRAITSRSELICLQEIIGASETIHDSACKQAWGTRDRSSSISWVQTLRGRKVATVTTPAVSWELEMATDSWDCAENKPPEIHSEKCRGLMVIFQKLPLRWACIAKAEQVRSVKLPSMHKCLKSDPQNTCSIISRATATEESPGCTSQQHNTRQRQGFPPGEGVLLFFFS